MAGRADGLNDIFDHNVDVKERLTTKEGTIHTTPIGNSDIVNKKYVDSKFGTSTEYWTFGTVNWGGTLYPLITPTGTAGNFGVMKGGLYLQEATGIGAVGIGIYNEDLDTGWALNYGTVDDVLELSRIGGHTANFYINSSALISGDVEMQGNIHINNAAPKLTLEESDTSNNNFQLAVSGTTFYIYEVNDTLVSPITRFTIDQYGRVTIAQQTTINGALKLGSIPSGATQAGSGAAATQVWKTASHASLPDNVLMIGV